VNTPQVSAALADYGELRSHVGWRLNYEEISSNQIGPYRRNRRGVTNRVCKSRKRGLPRLDLSAYGYG
jgi:hypothetical protein